MAQHAGYPWPARPPIAPALSSAVYNSGFRVIRATLRIDMGPRSSGVIEVEVDTQSSTADYHAFRVSYVASRPSLVTIAGADLTIAV